MPGTGGMRVSDIGEFLVKTFPNYTMEMWEGNIPCGKGHELAKCADCPASEFCDDYIGNEEEPQ